MQLKSGLAGKVTTHGSGPHPPAPSPPAQSPSQSPRPVPPLVEDLGKAVQESQQKDMQTKDLAETNKKLKEEVQTLGAEVKGLRAKERHAEEQREEMQSLQFELMEQLMSLQFKGADDAVAQCLRTGAAVGLWAPSCPTLVSWQSFCRQCRA